MKKIFFGCLTLSDSPNLRWVPGRYDGNIHRYYASGIAKSGKALLAKMKRAAKVEFPGWHIRGEVAYEISRGDILKAAVEVESVLIGDGIENRINWLSSGLLKIGNSVVGCVSSIPGGDFFAYGHLEEWQDTPLGSFETEEEAMRRVEEWVKDNWGTDEPPNLEAIRRRIGR